MNGERELRLQAESQHEIDTVTVQNLQQDLDMVRHRQQAVESELSAKVAQLQRALDNEREKETEITRFVNMQHNLP